ncbi:MAG TPA: hypothetical protein VHQ87_04670 [Rhizobacter sp.]|jgi:hypothetical protein|nr:hypothetical protein [Rhizobacter sp.]
MVQTALLVGRNPAVIDDVMSRAQAPGIRLLNGGNSVATVREVFASQGIQHVILGGGIDLEQRLEIVRLVFQLSSSTTVHMNSPSGPESFLPFVLSVLHGVNGKAA